MVPNSSRLGRDSDVIAGVPGGLVPVSERPSAIVEIDSSLCAMYGLVT